MSEFEKLLQENFMPLQRFINFKVSNRHDAQDLLQEVCLAATEKFDSLKDKSAFKAWLIGIAKHKCNDYYRKKAAHPFVSLDSLPETAFAMGRFGVTVQSAVRDTLELLPEQEKEILYLYFFQDLSQDEIARHLSVPLGTVKSRLHYAKEKFRQHYPYKETPKGDNDMKTFPKVLPKYTIEPVKTPVFSVVFEELPNWFIVPKTGEEINWASYDMPGRNITETVHSKVVSPVFIHGIEGVEINTGFESHGSEFIDAAVHTYYAQLTESHCRWLGESYIDKNSTKRLLTFLDGDDFISQWGYGEDNCGSETHLFPLGIIKRDGNDISVDSDKHIMDVVGRYTIHINNQDYDTVCKMEYWENGAITEQYLDKNGRTVLLRRFNKNDWAFSRYQKLWTELLPDNEHLTVNGETYVHWYDCVTDYIF